MPTSISTYTPPPVLSTQERNAAPVQMAGAITLVGGLAGLLANIGRSGSLGRTAAYLGVAALGITGLVVGHAASERRDVKREDIDGYATRLVQGYDHSNDGAIQLSTVKRPIDIDALEATSNTDDESLIYRREDGILLEMLPLFQAADRQGDSDGSVTRSEVAATLAAGPWDAFPERKIVPGYDS